MRLKFSLYSLELVALLSFMKFEKKEEQLIF
jgi:hypothetical protein